MKQQSRILIFTGIFILLGLGIYLPTLNYSFQFDDIIHISQNPHLSDFAQYKDISFWTNHLRRPVSKFSFSVSEMWANDNPAGHRIVNIFLHFINSILLFFLFRKIISLIEQRYLTNRNLSLPLALFIAGVFLVHPMQSQSIVYIVQRMNLLSSFFTLISLILFIQARVHIRDNKHLLRAAVILILALLSAVTGIFSKQNAAVAAVLIFLIEIFIFSGKEKFEKIFRIGILVGIPVVIAAYFLINGITGTKGSGTTPLQYFISQWPIYVKYLWMYFVPIGQNIDHMISPYTPPVTFKYILSLIINVGLITTAIFTKKFPLFRFGILWFYLAHSIESGFIPIDDLMVDHRNYLPYAGITLCLGSFVFFPIKRINFRLLTISILIVFFSICSFNRVQDWKTMETIWADSVEKNPDNKRGWNNLSYALLDKNPMKARENALIALSMDSCYHQAYDNLGVALMKMGDTSRAIKAFTNSISCKHSNSHIAFYNLGICYENHDNMLSLTYFIKALEYDPFNESVLKKIGGLQIKNGMYNEALESFKKALQCDPKDISNHINLAISYDEVGMTQKAIDMLLPFDNDTTKTENLFRVLANLYGRTHQYSKSEQAISKAIAINPSMANYLKRGYIREQYKNYQGAIEDYSHVQTIEYSKPVDQRIQFCRDAMNK